MAVDNAPPLVRIALFSAALNDKKYDENIVNFTKHFFICSDMHQILINLPL